MKSVARITDGEKWLLNPCRISVEACRAGMPEKMCEEVKKLAEEKNIPEQVAWQEYFCRGR